MKEGTPRVIAIPPVSAEAAGGQAPTPDGGGSQPGAAEPGFAWLGRQRGRGGSGGGGGGGCGVRGGGGGAAEILVKS